MVQAELPPLEVVRAKTLIPLTNELPARGMDALCAPLRRVDDGVITARGGTILSVEPYREFIRRAATGVVKIRDLGDVILAPGLINCHTHLELSYMAGQTKIGNGFCDWVESLIALVQTPPDFESIKSAMSTAIQSMRRSHTAGVGDITSRIPQTVLREVHNSGLTARLFLEVFGIDPAVVEPFTQTALVNPVFSLAGHAPYSTSGECLSRAKKWCSANNRPFSLHLAEHEDEVECLQSGRGKLHALLRGRTLPESWRPPGTTPVLYAAALGLLSPGTLAVHCVQCDAEDIQILAQSGAGVCLCPRSNALINVGEAPAKAFAKSGALLVLGTDSLASNSDLDLWNEAEYFLKKNILPANALLRMSTVNGASQLGYLQHIGKLEKGKRFCYTVFPSEMNTFFL